MADEPDTCRRGLGPTPTETASTTSASPDRMGRSSFGGWKRTKGRRSPASPSLLGRSGYRSMRPARPGQGRPLQLVAGYPPPCASEPVGRDPARGEREEGRRGDRPRDHVARAPGAPERPLARLRGERREIEIRLHELESRSHEPILNPDLVVDAVLDGLRDAKRLFAHGTMEERKRVVRTFIEGLTLSAMKRSGELLIKKLPTPELLSAGSVLGATAFGRLLRHPGGGLLDSGPGTCSPEKEHRPAHEMRDDRSHAGWCFPPLRPVSPCFAPPPPPASALA